MKRRYAVLIAAVPVVLVLALTAFYQIENRRGARARAVVEQELSARGEPLDLAVLVPPQVPDEQSLAKAPVIERALREGYISESSAQAAAFSDMPLGRGIHSMEVAMDSWTTGRPLPLADWQRQLAKSKQLRPPSQSDTPAANVLAALDVFAPLLDELVRETETRPQADAPINWRQEPEINIWFPAGPVYVKIISTLRLRASAALAQGQHEEALRDTLAALRLCEALGREPLMIGCLEDISGTSLAIQPVWEGLATRRWTAEELLSLQQALRRDNHLENYVRTARGDRVIGCMTLESIRKSAENGEALLSGGGGRPVAPVNAWLARFFTVMPRGWIDQNRASICRLYQGCIDTVDLSTHRVLPEKVAAVETDLQALGRKPYLVYTLLARIVVQVETYLLPRAARTQTACDQARVACALERHYLEHGGYPDALSVLVPAYLDDLPADVMDGAPMRYRHTDDGRYILYGVGWNGRDEGGAVAWQRAASPRYPSRPDDKEGDWVWRYTAINPPAGTP